MMTLRRSDPDVFEFEWADVLIAPWRRDRGVTGGEIVRPLTPMGFYATCAVGGRTGGREPKWKGLDGVSVQDGSVTWTMNAPGSVSIPSLSAAVYTVTPTGISQSVPVQTGTRSSVKLDASTAALGKYLVVAEITANGEDYSLEQDLEVVDY